MATAAAASPAKKDDKKKKADKPAGDKKKAPKPEGKAKAKPAPAAAAKPASAAAAAAAATHVPESKAAHKKISKPKGHAATELENAVARALLELESTAKDLAADLTDLFIVSAKEVTVDAQKKAIVVFVPYRQHAKYKKIQQRLVRELEKKLSRPVVIIAQRTILSQSHGRKTQGQIRPRSRTLTAVHNAVLEDLVYPTLIVGKRLRVKLDGSRLLKVHLDPKDAKEADHKLKVFGAVYSALTNKAVEFIFPLADDA